MQGHDLGAGGKILAEIDAPENGQAFGNRSKQHLAELCFSKAATVRPRTTDRYGRTVAYLELDGGDFGELMIERGFAVAWAGKRQNWCGPRGGLVALAKACSTEWQCNTCHGQHTPRRTNNGSVVTLPVVYRRKV